MNAKQEAKFLKMIIADVRLPELVRMNAKLKLEEMEK